LMGRCTVGQKALTGDLKGTVRDVHAGELRELFLPRKRREHTSLAAAEIEHCVRSLGFELGYDGTDPLFGQSDRTLNGLLFGGVRLFCPVRVEAILLNQPRQCSARQPARMAQVALGDQRPFWVSPEPSLALPQKLFH